MGPPGLGLEIISHQGSPFPRHVLATLHHRAVSGASDQGSWFAGLLLLERRPKHIFLVLLPLGEVEIWVPCPFLHGFTLERAESWPGSIDVGSRGLR